MRYFNSTNTYIETNCIKKHEKEILSIGTRAFIVTGKSSVKNGALQDMIDVLTKNEVPYTIYNEIEENPSTSTVYKASRFGIEFKADFVIGIGGGSPLDASKAIAMLIKHPDLEEECLWNKKDGLTSLPVITVPTTCGTGAEVTPNAVLTYHNQKKKSSMPYKFFPVLALVDGRYIVNAPKELIINTSIDALSHALESYLNTSSNTYNRMFSKYALELWKDCKEILKEKTITIEQANHLMMTSTIAGMAISQTGTSLPHYFGYDLTYYHHIPHGLACGIFQIAYLKTYETFDKDTIQDICSYVDFKNLDEMETYLQSCLPKIKIDKQDMYTYINKVSKNISKLKTFPFTINEKVIEDMYIQSFETLPM